jgi:hypothetical protein
LFGFYFLENEVEEVVTRDVRTLFQMLSDLGGFLEIVFFLTSLIVFAVQKFYFEQAVIKSLFMEDTYQTYKS